VSRELSDRVYFSGNTHTILDITKDRLADFRFAEDPSIVLKHVDVQELVYLRNSNEILKRLI